MQPPLPSATPSWHNDTYAAISPKRPELSASGKAVVITGAGSGIGRETAIAFATAGAARIALLGRTEASLRQTAAALPSTVSVSVYVVDVTSEESLIQVAAAIGTWDVLILGAGHVAVPSSIAASSFAEFWQSFETNAKGTYASLHAFLPTANASHAAVLAVTTGTTALPATMVPGLSAYMSSKLAQTKLIEFLAAEQPNLFAATVHPGMVETEVFIKSGAKAESLPMDKVQLPAHFMVWLASPEAAFLNGRSVWANWDVNELKAKTDAIKQSQLYTAGINGWPFTP
ncbi:NAD(P)-binding protein [Trichoderma citrinoviride]|uniref:NAD(P)-binding protein n=1 Tax=Trichoderma citrinoviride TaxID=58853 RepID=A0A2T4AZ01_9HYPO|nr:NAD(P)-binding protein [Trichoderma citrinoviride]PTB62297.1 NAD(P)-binding protein [Trichoderma citrinoviride]